uniref:Homeobox domain-containing protein n=1 Tax=Piliocolobus tephrosceles TaxID=591936 RepID=A0A8C9J6L0_9PRIM
MSPAEMPHTETVSPLPSSMDLLIQESPDSPTSPKGKQPTAVPVKKQKTRTLFSSTQLCVPIDRFQRQKYLSLQQMQELSNILNLSYKQVKTWFQNQRMKSKRWQKNNWPQNSNGVTQASAPTYPSLYSSYHRECLSSKCRIQGRLAGDGCASQRSPGLSTSVLQTSALQFPSQPHRACRV